MNRYRYRAIDGAGRIHVGTLAAVHTAELEVRLARGGLELLRARRCRQALPFGPGRRVPRATVARFCFHLEQLLRAGVPVAEALEDVTTHDGDSRLGRVAGDLVAAVESGCTLSEALSAHPGIFGPVALALVRVGEETGRLPETLHEIGAMLRWQERIIADTRRALMYPLLVLAVIAAVLAFLFTWLVPRLIDFLGAVGGELPPQTVALIAVSAFVREHGFLLLAVIALPVAVIPAIARGHDGLRLLLDHMKLRLWLYGPLHQRLCLARFARGLARMYAAGIALPDAVRLACGLLDNAALEQAADRAHRAILDGEGPAEAFAGEALFPPMVIRMLRIGAYSGAFDRAMDEIGDWYARTVQDAVDRLQPTLQPVLTIVLGMMIGWIALAVLGPVYHAITHLDP